MSWSASFRPSIGTSAMRYRCVIANKMGCNNCNMPWSSILLASRTRKVSCAPNDVDSTKSPFEDQPLYKAVTFLSRGSSAALHLRLDFSSKLRLQLRIHLSCSLQTLPCENNGPLRVQSDPSEAEAERFIFHPSKTQWPGLIFLKPRPLSVNSSAWKYGNLHIVSIPSNLLANYFHSEVLVCSIFLVAKHDNHE